MITTAENKQNLRDYKGVVLRRKDPYGFWFLENEDGKTLSVEAFTSLADARLKVDEILKAPVENKKKK